MKKQEHAKLTYGDFTLVNKLTGRRASSTNWLLDNAAIALLLGQHTGLPSLLPQSQAINLLIKNELKFFNRHKCRDLRASNNTSHAALRELAQKALPYLAVYYIEHIVPGRNPTQVNRKGFRSWLVEELSNQHSRLNNQLRYHPDFEALTELRREEDWWRKRQQVSKNRE